MVSISERIKGLRTRVKDSIEKERQIRKEEKAAYQKAKEAEAKAQAEFRKFNEAKKRAERIEKAREKGIRAALPGHRREEAKELAKKSASGLSAFLKEHVEFIPEREYKRPTKRKMKHKQGKQKRHKQRRY